MQEMKGEQYKAAMNDCQKTSCVILEKHWVLNYGEKSFSYLPKP